MSRFRMSRLTLWLSVVLVLLLSACASMNEEECLSANWNMIGLEDGARGASINTLSQHRKACAKVGVVPDRSQYEAGHAEGMERFCNYDNGYSLGDSGAKINLECPQSAQSFVAGYEKGLRVHRAREQLNIANRAIAKTQSDIESLSIDISALEAELVDGLGDRHSRREALINLEQLQEELQVQTEDLVHQQYRQQRAQRQYDRLLQP